MTTATPDEQSSGVSALDRLRRTRDGAIGLVDRLRAGVRAGQAALDRPLTSYYLLLGATALLLVIGLIMVFSASSVRSLKETGDSYYYVKRQLTWVMIGLPLAWVATRLPTRHLRRLAFIGYGISIVLLILVSRFGTEVGGNKNWLSFGPVGIQPSEVAKLALVLWAAHIFARKDRRLHKLNEIVVPVVPGMIVMIGLVLLGNDLGTALVFGAIAMALLWVVGAPLRIFVALLALVSAGALTLAATSPTRLARLQNFVDPLQNYHTTGWQPSHGLFALSTGGWGGTGLGGSAQKWGGLGEAHTDYIFAVIGEELGFVGTGLVLALFLAIAWAGVRVALRATEPFVRYMSFGIVAWILSQALINIGMVVGVLPVIGIPLPLISYGGSALLPSLIAMGLLVGFARADPDAKAALEARRRKGPAGLSAATAGRQPQNQTPRD